MAMATSAQVVFGAFSAAIRPPDAISIERWAEDNVIMGPLTAEPGPWRADRTPYVRDILRCMGPDHPCRVDSWVAGTQLGKTTAELLIASYYLAQVPSSVMITLPTKALAEEWSTKRLNEIFDSSPSLRGALVDVHDRRSDGVNTKFSKLVPGGGAAKIAWSSSATMLRSTPVKIVLNDEVEKFEGDVDDEGSALRLIEKRQTNFYGSKTLNASSPGMYGQSQIWPEFEKGDQRFYFVPCPSCRHAQVLRFENLDWPKGHPELVCFRCISCREAIFEKYKTEMLANGVWVATADHPVLLDSGFAMSELDRLAPSFEQMAAEKFVSHHLAAFYSPTGWYSWAEAAREWEASENDPNARKVYVNTTQAELWKSSIEIHDFRVLVAGAEDYPRGVVPEGAALVTAGVDVQKDYLAYEVAAWGPNRQRWSIDYQNIAGDTSQPAVWRELHELLMREWPTARGGRLPIHAMAIDTGFRPEMGYEFARSHNQVPYNPAEWRAVLPRTVICTKGTSSFNAIITNVSSEDAAAKRFGVRVFSMGTGAIKLELIENLKIRKPEPGEPVPTGYCHFPRYADTYFQGLCSERLVMTRKGEPQFQRDPALRNEPLDVAVMNRAAMALCGANDWSESQWRQRLAAAEPPSSVAAKTTETTRKALRPIVPSDPYLD